MAPKMLGLQILIGSSSSTRIAEPEASLSCTFRQTSSSNSFENHPSFAEMDRNTCSGDSKVANSTAKTDNFIVRTAVILQNNCCYCYCSSNLLLGDSSYCFACCLDDDLHPFFSRIFSMHFTHLSPQNHLHHHEWLRAFPFSETLCRVSPALHQLDHHHRLLPRFRTASPAHRCTRRHLPPRHTYLGTHAYFSPLEYTILHCHSGLRTHQTLLC